MPQRSRRRFDDDDLPTVHRSTRTTRTAPPPADAADEPAPSWSTYPDSAHGPSPVPEWVITSGAALDEDLGVLKSGKEADVSLVRRSHGERVCLLAVKRYRDAHHRLFHRDAGYLEGRRLRRTRETRAMAHRTEFGREIIAQQWAVAEFHVLGRLWSAGAAVPYPVQLLGNEVAMEFVGDTDGVAAPRLAQLRPERDEASALFEQVRDALRQLAVLGYAHGDLSAYNVLVQDGRVVLIDLPQAVDLVGNPQGFAYLTRDCERICEWFHGRGVDADARALCADLLRELPVSG